MTFDYANNTLPEGRRPADALAAYLGTRLQPMGAADVLDRERRLGRWIAQERHVEPSPRVIALTASFAYVLAASLPVDDPLHDDGSFTSNNTLKTETEAYISPSSLLLRAALRDQPGPEEGVVAWLRTLLASPHKGAAALAAYPNLERVQVALGALDYLLTRRHLLIGPDPRLLDLLARLAEDVRMNAAALERYAGALKIPVGLFGYLLRDRDAEPPF